MNLTDIERQKVRVFLEDEEMCEAVKKVLLAVADVSPTELALQYTSNENLGAVTRALAAGKKFVEQGFDKLLEYQKRDIIMKKKNKAL